MLLNVAPKCEHLYSLYIMASLSGVLYIGVTSDLQTRVRQHKAGSFKGFSKYRCRRLVYYERYDYMQTAIGREKQLQDLSESWEREHLIPRKSMKEADESNAKRIKLSIDGSGPRSLAEGELDRDIPGDPSRKRSASG